MEKGKQSPQKYMELTGRSNEEPREISKFKELMRNFYKGRIWIEDDAMTSDIKCLQHVKVKIKTELQKVMEDQYEYEDDTNLKAMMFTQQTQEELGSILKSFGLELKQKYVIKKIEDSNTTAHYIYPTFAFIDMNKIQALLSKIDSKDDELYSSLEKIIDVLGEKIANGFDKERSDEEIDIFSGIKEFNLLLKKSKVRENEIMNYRRNIFTALEKGCLVEYKEALLLGFYCNIQEGIYPEATKLSPPIFFDEIFDAKRKNDKGINYPDICKTLVKNIETEIEERRGFLERIKNKPAIAKRVYRELITGIVGTTEIIKDIKSLEKEEKEDIISQFDEYCVKIIHLNGGTAF